jgi:hypothetical protein
MSPLSPDLPSRPESAHNKYTENVASEATGFQNTSYQGLKSQKNRRRPRATHDILPKPPESPKNVIFTHFQKKAEEKENVHCVFLLWGSENSEISTTWAVDVPIADPMNEDEVFASLAKQYATELGFLRRFLSFRKFSKLRPVTVCFNHIVAYLSVLKSDIVPVDQPFLKQILSFR